MKTRTTKKPPSTTKTAPNPRETTATTTNTKALEPPVSKPPHLFILPQNLSPTARILTLPHPATSTPSRYLLDPDKQQCYEFTRVAAPRKACRSWLLAPERSTWGDEREDERGHDGKKDEGYVVERPDLLMATPIDPLFLILPALLLGIGDEGGKQMYLSPSDYLDRLEEQSVQFKDLMSGGANEVRRNVEQMFEIRIRSVCDVMDIGDGEVLYRLSTAKLLDVIFRKAKTIMDRGLFPPSMEEKFVKQTLAVPVLSVRREESSISLAAAVDDDDDQNGEEAESENTSSSAATSQEDSQTSSTTTTSTSTASTSTSSPPEPREETKETDPGISHLLRLRTVITYILTSYTPPSLRKSLTTLLSHPSSSPIDFSPLNTHLDHLDTLKKEAQTLRSLSDNISRKRNHADEDDEEAREKAEAKKRKKEDEEMRKKNVSRGVKALEKVDRSGMKTLSSFFAAKPNVKKN